MAQKDYLLQSIDSKNIYESETSSISENSFDFNNCLKQNSYETNLEILQSIRDKTKNIDLDLPTLVVVGDQSSGKSSLLESITDIPLPKGTGTVTKSPIYIQCSKNNDFENNKFYICINNKEEEIDKKNLEEKILEIQKTNINKIKNTISETEIKIKVIGPQQMDIQVVDLPGIIHNGEDEEVIQVDNLIQKYIKKTSTLILLVTEARRDDEQFKGLKITENYSDRTLRIFTKCDLFDTSEKITEVKKKIEDSLDDDYGCHAVCVSNELTKIDLDNKHIGIENLKHRLPKIFAELIKSNIEPLKKNIEKIKNTSETELKNIGKEDLNDIELIEKFLKKIKKTNICAKITRISEIKKIELLTFNKKLNDNMNNWVDENHEENMFIPPICQGEETINKFISKWLEEFRPIYEKYKNNLEQFLCEFVSIEINIPEQLKNIIKKKWIEFYNKILTEFNNEIENTIFINENRFGTENHYLTANYDEIMSFPEESKQQLAEKISNEKFLSNYCILGRNQINVFDLKKEIIKYIEETNEERIEEYKKKDMIGQVKDRISKFLIAYIKTENKTINDNIMKITHKQIITEMEKWKIDLKSDIEIKKYAKEDEKIKNERKRLINIIETLNECTEQLNNMVLN